LVHVGEKGLYLVEPDLDLLHVGEKGLYLVEPDLDFLHVGEKGLYLVEPDLDFTPPPKTAGLSYADYFEAIHLGGRDSRIITLSLTLT